MRRMVGVTALVALLVLVAGGAAAASPPPSAASTASRPPAWVQREARWQSLAAGEPQPSLLQWCPTMPARAARLAGSATSYLRSLPWLGKVHVVVLRGRFGAPDASGTSGDRLYLVLRAQDHGYLAHGVTSARGLDLAGMPRLHRFVPRLPLSSGVWGHTMAQGGPFPGGPWPLAHVTVAVWPGADAPDSDVPLTRAYSDWAGFFALQLAPGDYTFRLGLANAGWQAPTTVTVEAGAPVAAGVYTYPRP